MVTCRHALDTAPYSYPARFCGKMVSDLGNPLDPCVLPPGDTLAVPLGPRSGPVFHLLAFSNSSIETPSASQIRTAVTKRIDSPHLHLCTACLETPRNRAISELLIPRSSCSVRSARPVSKIGFLLFKTAYPHRVMTRLEVARLVLAMVVPLCFQAQEQKHTPLVA